jgi:3-hydroxyisobutyrate dehydrogenase-like beta-hydroxyacid dehydrogenase
LVLYNSEGEKMKVGFIGLGNMGSGMAANLVKAGHEVAVYNRTAARMQALVGQGAHPAAQVADACRGDVVISMLANDDAVESVMLGNEGVIASLGEGCLHVSMSTISVALSEKLTAAHTKARRRFVAAPVFGRPEAAAAGQLFIMAAGEQDALDICKPLFEALGQKTFTFGNNPPSANLVKLSGNFLIASVIEALGEAMALVGKAGIDRNRYLDCLTSTLFGAPVYKTYGALITGKKFKPAGFAAPLGYKDMRLVLEAADKFKVPLPLASLLKDRLMRLLALGREELDWSAIAQLAADDAGLRD